MKTRVRLWLMLVLWSMPQVCFAQFNTMLQDEVKQITIDSLSVEDDTYIVEKIDYGVTKECILYNIGNTHNWREETKITSQSFVPEAKNSFVNANEQMCVARQIVNEAFTEEQVAIFNSEYQNEMWDLGVLLIVSTQSDKVESVYFSYHPDSMYAKISLSVYAVLEKRLKERVHFELTPYGRTKPTCGRVWFQVPQGSKKATDSSDNLDDGQDLLDMPNENNMINEGRSDETRLMLP